MALKSEVIRQRTGQQGYWEFHCQRGIGMCFFETLQYKSAKGGVFWAVLSSSSQGRPLFRIMPGGAALFHPPLWDEQLDYNSALTELARTECCIINTITVRTTQYDPPQPCRVHAQRTRPPVATETFRYGNLRLWNVYAHAFIFELRHHRTMAVIFCTVELHLSGRRLSGSAWLCGQICREFYKTNLP